MKSYFGYSLIAKLGKGKPNFLQKNEVFFSFPNPCLSIAICML